MGNATPLRVVIVEDSELIRGRLEEAFREIDNVSVAGHAETESAALALLGQEKWDLLILDLQLKKGTGLGVLQALRNTVKHAGGKVAVFTNFALPQYRARSLALGADYFFDKARELPRLLRLAADLATRSPRPAAG
jgi:DNA-binding NarL/FixJ family response regulator